MKANHKKAWVPMKIGRGETEIEVMPGQFIFGRKSAAKELRMPESSIWKRMKKLKNMQNVDIESNSKYSTITVTNWDAYQPDKNKGDSKGDRQVTGKEQARNTNNNDKNEKKVNTPPNGNGKKEYREYVKLKPSEYERLLKEFGDTQTKWMLDTLDGYIGAMPKKRNKYTDHNRVLRGWVLEKYQTNNPAQRQQDIYEDLN